VDDWISKKEPAEGSRETTTGEPEKTIGEQGRDELAKRQKAPRDRALLEQPEGEASGGTSARPGEADDDTAT
jgi:hypothetical protein